MRAEATSDAGLSNYPRIDALVSMDGSMRYYPGLVKMAGDVHPERMTIPLLFFTAEDANFFFSSLQKMRTFLKILTNIMMVPRQTYSGSKRSERPDTRRSPHREYADSPDRRGRSGLKPILALTLQIRMVEGYPEVAERK
jgi:hypothetical protein